MEPKNGIAWTFCTRPDFQTVDRDFTFAMYLHNEHLFLLGGKPFLLRYSLSTNRWTQLHSEVPHRYGFSLIPFSDCFYLYGGATKERYFDDLWRYDLVDYWVPISEPNIGEREDSKGLGIEISEKLILFGGVNLSKGQIYSDVNVFDIKQKVWARLLLKGESFFPRLGFSVNPLQDRAFVFGGMGPSSCYYNQLFEIRYSCRHTTSVTFDKVNSVTVGPSARANHGAVVVDKNLLIMGGQSRSKEQLTAFSDIWLYDSVKKSWRLIEQKDVYFGSRFGFAIAEDNKDIFLYGGLSATRLQVHRELIRIDYDSLSGVKAQSFTIPKVKASAYFLQQVSALILSPLQAVSLLVEAAEILEASKVRLSLKKHDSTKSDFKRELTLQFSGRPLDPSDFIQLNKKMEYTSSFPRDQRIRLFSKLVREGALRLGSSVLVVERNEHILKVLLVSSSLSINFEPDGEFRSSFYVENTDTGQFIGENGHPSKNDKIYYYQTKRTIWNFLSGFRSQAEARTQKEKFSVSVFGLRADCLEYELREEPGHIHCANPTVRAQCAYKEMIDYSLNRFLEYYYKDRALEITVCSRGVSCTLTPRLAAYITARIENGTAHFQKEQIEASGLIHSMVIYKVDQPENPGILVYSANRLVYRVGREFGQARGWVSPCYFGIVELSESVKLNYLRNGVEDRKLQEEIARQIFTIKAVEAPSEDSINVISLQDSQ